MRRNILASIAFALSIPTATPQAEPLMSDRLASGLPRSGETQGEIVELDANDGGFIAIFQRSQRDPNHGGIILLHDQATSANSLEVIRPLRLGLAQAGWDTLALQLPSASRDESRVAWQSRQAEIIARLQAGLAWLKSRKQLKQVILAQGDSGAIALRFASDKPPRELQALVLVSTTIDPGESDDMAATLGRLGLPVLDIYAERDRSAVLDAAPRRKNAATERKDQGYRQAEVPGAMAGFFGLEDGLLSRIRGWLAVNAKAHKTDTR